MSDRDVIDLLLEDHQDFRALFARLDATPTHDREQLFQEIVARLATHEAAEEAVVHRTVRDDVPDGETVAEERMAEEAEAEQLIAKMADMDPASDEFTDAMIELKNDVLEHAQNEERHEFPRLREHVSVEERQELGRRFVLLRDTGPTRPHPNTPQSPEVRGLAGPIVGLFDRARDAAREAFSQ